MTLTRRHLIGGAAAALAIIVGGWTHGTNAVWILATGNWVDSGT
jgi:hypothetical protein